MTDPHDTEGMPRGLKFFLLVLALVVVAFIVVHLTVGGLGRHG